MTPALYLAGPIFGCTDEQARDWREVVSGELRDTYRILSPMRRDYRGREDQHVRQIVEGDLRDISAADVVLVMAAQPSWGTAMEVRIAWETRRHVVVIHPTSRVSPWLRYHAHEIVPSVEAALSYLRTYAGGAPRASAPATGEP